MTHGWAPTERHEDGKLTIYDLAWGALTIVLLAAVGLMTALAQPVWASQPLVLLLLPIVFGTVLLLVIAAHDRLARDH